MNGILKSLFITLGILAIMALGIVGVAFWIEWAVKIHWALTISPFVLGYAVWIFSIVHKQRVNNC